LPIVAAAYLALSACTTTSIDTTIQTNHPNACQSVETAHVAFSAVAAPARAKAAPWPRPKQPTAALPSSAGTSPASRPAIADPRRLGLCRHIVCPKGSAQRELKLALVFYLTHHPLYQVFGVIVPVDHLARALFIECRDDEIDPGFVEYRGVQ
jgi:hypothetical protein